MIFRRQFDWQPTTAAGGGGGACGERRSLWGTERAAGNRCPFLSASLPRNIARSQRGDNTFTAPTGRLKPIGRPVEKPVVTGHLGSGWRRLYLGRIKPANRRAVMEKRTEDVWPLHKNDKVTGGRCPRCCRGCSWTSQRRSANVNGDKPRALCKWSSLVLLFPLFSKGLLPPDVA